MKKHGLAEARGQAGEDVVALVAVYNGELHGVEAGSFAF